MHKFYAWFSDSNYQNVSLFIASTISILYTIFHVSKPIFKKESLPLNSLLLAKIEANFLLVNLSSN